MNKQISLLAFIAVLCLDLAGCDGFYYLVPAPPEGREVTVNESSELVFARQGLEVTVGGFHGQAPGLTKKIRAAQLSVAVNIETDSTCYWNAPSIYLISAGRKIRSTSVNELQHLDSLREKVYFGTPKEPWPAPSQLEREIPGGNVTFYFGFEAAEGGQKQLEFPIVLFLGTIRGSHDTLSLDSLTFGAKRGFPNEK